MQEGHLVVYASRALTPTECNYAQIEKELLAVVFGMERFENYAYGRHIKVESDHKPLEIIQRKSLVVAPRRLQRMLLRLQKFEYHIVYKKGAEMYVADILSRAYLPVSDKDEEKASVFDIDQISYISISEGKIRKIKEAAEADENMKLLKVSYSQDGQSAEMTFLVQFSVIFLSEINLLSKIALYLKVKGSLYRKEFAETSLIEFTRLILESRDV